MVHRHVFLLRVRDFSRFIATLLRPFRGNTGHPRRRAIRPLYRARPHGQALADVYFEDDPGRRSAEKLLTILRTLLGLDPLMRSLSSPLLRHRLTVLTTQAVEDVNLGHLFQVKIAY